MPGTCLNAWGDDFALNLLVEMGKTIGQSIRSEHFGFFTISGVLSPAHRGKHIFEKGPETKNEKLKQIAIADLQGQNRRPWPLDIWTEQKATATAWGHGRSLFYPLH